MNKQQKILMLRASYWTGAIIDLLAAIQLLIPQLWATMDNFATYSPNTTLNFALYVASSLMFGWTFLLIWADRKPLERKSVLLLTVFPVVFGLALNNVWALASGLRQLESTLPELAMQVVVGSFLAFSYLNARKETQ
jgi:hypothetical protein